MGAGAKGPLPQRAALQFIAFNCVPIGGIAKKKEEEPKMKSYIIIELFLEINLGIGSRASESGGGK